MKSNSISHKYIYLSHILFGGPLLAYVGFMKQKTHNHVYKLLLLVGVIIALYHLYKLYIKFSKKKYISYVNLLHLLLVVPLLIYVGLYKEKVVYPTFDLLFAMGIGIIILFILKMYQ